LIITMYSHIGMDLLGLHLPVPFGVRGDVWQLLLSLPVVFWSASIFFVGALAALRARTLDMMVLVAVGIGTGWAYSVGVTLTGGGDVFYEAATMLAAFVLLGTGSRCAPEGAPTTPFARCSILRRRWRSSSATVSPWRFPP